jgi:glycosyltransferase involved in cell wall biosynthesis
MPAYSVVVLCYRAGEAARPFVREVIDLLEAEMRDWELVLVANYIQGGDDATPEVVRQIAEGDERIRTVAQPKQGMMGWDLRSGLEAATGDVVGFIDGDGQMNPLDLIRAYRILRERHADLVMTYRVLRGDSLYRTAISRVYNGAFRVLFPGTGLRDINSKPKVFTRAAYDRLKLTSDDWFIDAEIVIQARRMRMSMVDIPTEFRKLENRASFVRASAIVEFVTNLAKARVKEFIE